MDDLGAAFPQDAQGGDGVQGATRQARVACSHPQAEVPTVRALKGARRLHDLWVLRWHAAPVEGHTSGQGVGAEVGLEQATVGQVGEGGADREMEGRFEPDSPGESGMEAEVPRAGQGERGWAVGSV